MNRIIAMALVVLTVMMVALVPVCAAAESDWAPSDDDSIPMAILKWNMRGVEHVAEGLLWVGSHVADGAVWVGENVADGAVWVGEHVADGAVWVADVACEFASGVADAASSFWGAVTSLF